jgi:hypothetical protein
VPDDILIAVADEIDAHIKSTALKCQPRLSEIERMCTAGLSVRHQLDAALARRLVLRSR